MMVFIDATVHPDGGPVVDELSVCAIECVAVPILLFNRPPSFQQVVVEHERTC